LLSGILEELAIDPRKQPKWAFFVDDAPEANWEHPCRYIFVLENGEIVEVPETAPPSARHQCRIERVNGPFPENARAEG
jgi:hypothetical protein